MTLMGQPYLTTCPGWPHAATKQRDLQKVVVTSHSQITYRNPHPQSSPKYEVCTLWHSTAEKFNSSLIGLEELDTNKIRMAALSVTFIQLSDHKQHS